MDDVFPHHNQLLTESFSLFNLFTGIGRREIKTDYCYGHRSHVRRKTHEQLIQCTNHLGRAQNEIIKVKEDQVMLCMTFELIKKRVIISTYKLKCSEDTTRRQIKIHSKD